MTLKKSWLDLVGCAGLKLGGVGFQGEDSLGRLDRGFLIYLPVLSVLSSQCLAFSAWS